MEGRQKPVKNELFTIGPLTVYGYGAMIALGVIAAWIVTECRARKLRLSSDHVFALVLWGLLGGIVCAKLLYWITEWDSVMKDPGFLLDTLTDGFVVYGGIIGGILAGWIYCRAKKINFWAYFDLVMPSVALAQGFGRIGCLLAGCCYGKETESFFSVIFQNSEYAPNHVALIPTQLYSSGLDFLHFLLLLLIHGLLQLGHFGILLYIARHKKKDGQVAACYLIFYSVGRFVIEFFRGDIIRGSVGILSTSQFISIFTGIAGIVLLVLVAKKRSPQE